MRALLCILSTLMVGLCSSCSSDITQAAQTLATLPQTATTLALSTSFTSLPATDPLSGNIVPVHDPSLMRRTDGSYISYTTDLPFLNNPHFIAQRCSPDGLAWQSCGYVFDTLPAWISAQYPGATGIWAPDISFFGGKYHLYYAVSSFGTQHSAIGQATNETLDPSDPRYQWVDGGPILASTDGADFNAIDPNVFVDTSGGQPRIWLTYGSYWGGIYQGELDPVTGQLLPGATRYHLAQQPAALQGALEGAAMVAHNGWYYLFASVGLCCEIPIEKDTYQQIVGRSRSLHGPFVTEDGGSMLAGNGTVLLTSDANWLAPGGGSLWQSADGAQTLLTFHALHRSENGALDLWVEQVDWVSDWPVLHPLT